MTEEPDPLDRYWALFDSPDPVICAQETVWWPPGALAGLIAPGLLVPTSSAAQVACTACADRHVEEIEVARGPEGTVRFFIACPENVRVEVDAEQLRRWRPDFKLLARRLKELLAIDGRVRDRVAERAWRLGSVPWKQRPREVYLVRGLAWADGATIARQIPTEDRPIVFVGMGGAPATVWPGIPPALAPLGAVLHTSGDQLSLDVQLLLQLISGADETAARLGNVASKDLKRRVHQFAEQRMEAGSKIGLIADCRSQGMSTRATEAAMKKRGVQIDHSSIARKIERVVNAGPPPSSGSILRSASSQPRDKRGRPITDAQPEKE